MKEHAWIIKSPKSYAGDRYIEFPDFVADKRKGIHGRIMELNPDMITKRFEHVLCVPVFRIFVFTIFVIIQHALEVPDAYIMQRGGWSNDGVLKAVYRHTLSDKSKQYSDMANDHFDKLCNTTKKIASK